MEERVDAKECMGRSEDNLQSQFSSTKWVLGAQTQVIRFGSKHFMKYLTGP